MIQVELAIVGAGPAGLAAAIQARELNVDTLVLDENAAAGGQIYRQPPGDFDVLPTLMGPTFARGRALLAAARAAGVEVRFETVVWSLDQQLKLELVSSAGPETIEARRVIVAAGAYDRPVPVSDWTLPGVFTVGGLQNLLKTQSIVAGRRVLLAGTGPLLLVVASQVAATGVELIVTDPVPRRAALTRLPSMVGEWSLLRDGAGYHWNLMRRGSRWLSPYVISAIGGDGRVEQATVARVDASWRRVPGTERTFEVDAVGLGYGLLPSLELLRLAGCELRHDETISAWLPVVDDEGTTSIPGLAVAGDGAGIAGAVAAVEQGRVAAIAAARDLGRIDASTARDLLRPSRARLKRLGRFRAAMDTLYSPRSGLNELATPDTTVCRCEEVTASEIDDAIAAGAGDIELLKIWTRVTMGPCQGRMCIPALAERLRSRTHRKPALPRARPPCKPLPVAWLKGASQPAASPSQPPAL
jgi:NADPH-dependent 2,4-dienoyl-CoA reductase/sulfur reductase-like enzyme